MTRITGVSVSRVRLRFRAPVRHGQDTVATQEAAILRLTTDDALTGLGEVAGPVPPRDLEAAIERLSRRLVDTDPATFDDFDAGVLTGALDTALLDVLGRAQGRRVADLLGGGTPSVRINGLMTVGVGSVDVAAGTAQALVAGGFRTIKIKRVVGTAGARVDDALRAVRDAVGPGVALRLDLNGDLTERDAVGWLISLGPLALEYVEQPISPSLGVAALARVRAAVPMPLAADESVTDAAAARVLLEEGAADVLVIKPSRVGGPRACVRIARAAETAGVAVTISTMYDSGIGLAAALHVASAIPGDRAHGIGTAALLVSDLIDGGLPIVGGRMVLPARPGLGVTLDESAVASAMALAMVDPVVAA
jgi:L-alanine-DL-glutamate epimerase-like enolase superfamily enzyme